MGYVWTNMIFSTRFCQRRRGVSIQIVQAMEDSAELRRCIQEIAEVMLQRGVSYARPVSKRVETMRKLWGNYGMSMFFLWQLTPMVDACYTMLLKLQLQKILDGGVVPIRGSIRVCQ